MTGYTVTVTLGNNGGLCNGVSEDDRVVTTQPGVTTTTITGLEEAIQYSLVQLQTCTYSVTYYTYTMNGKLFSMMTTSSSLLLLLQEPHPGPMPQVPHPPLVQQSGLHLHRIHVVTHGGQADSAGAVEANFVDAGYGEVSALC